MNWPLCFVILLFVGCLFSIASIVLLAAAWPGRCLSGWACAAVAGSCVLPHAIYTVCVALALMGATLIAVALIGFFVERP